MKTNKILSLAVSAAMMIGMATTAFAVAGVSTDVSIDDSTVTSYTATIGSSFVAEAIIYDGNSNVSEKVGATADWTLVVTGTKVTTDVTTVGATADEKDSAKVLSATEFTDVEDDAALPDGTVALTDGSVFASKSIVAGTDGKSVKVTLNNTNANSTVFYTNAAEDTYYKVVTTYDISTLKLHLLSEYGTGNSDTQDVALTIKDNRFTDVAYAAGKTGVDTAFDVTPANVTDKTTVEDGIVTDIDLGSFTQVTYKLLQAIYNQEEEVNLVQGDITYTIDGLNMSSFAKANVVDTKIMTLSISTKRLSRTLRTAIAEASKTYGAAFATAVAEDPDDYDYYPLDLSDITVPDEVGSVVITFNPDDVYEGGDLADFAADGELYMYLYDDGEFTLFDTVDVTGRRGDSIIFEIEDGDQGQYILTTTKLVAGGTTSSEATSSVAPVSSEAASTTEPIPDTSDANVIAIAVMMAVIAMAGAALVAKKATK